MHIINAQIEDIKDPEIDVSITPEFIIQSQQAILSWNSKNTISVDIQPSIGVVKLFGSVTINPFESTTYQITAKGVLKDIVKNVSISVYPTPILEKLRVPKAPDIRLEANFQLEKMEVPDIFKTSILEKWSHRFPRLQMIKSEFIPQRPKFKDAVEAFQITDKQINENKLKTIRPIDRLVNKLKTNSFNVLERSFRNNRKMTDIIKTIRKHYE